MCVCPTLDTVLFAPDLLADVVDVPAAFAPFLASRFRLIFLRIFGANVALSSAPYAAMNVGWSTGWTRVDILTLTGATLPFVARTMHGYSLLVDVDAPSSCGSWAYLSGYIVNISIEHCEYQYISLTPLLRQEDAPIRLPRRKEVL